jgi:hypothetical protein
MLRTALIAALTTLTLAQPALAGLDPMPVPPTPGPLQCIPRCIPQIPPKDQSRVSPTVRVNTPNLQSIQGVRSAPTLPSLPTLRPTR